MLRAREITKTNQNKSYYKGRNEINQNGVVCTQNGKSREFRYKQNFCYIAKFPVVAKFSLLALFINVGYCSIAPHCYYSISSCFDILHSQLAEIDRKPYEIDGNQPDVVMIGLTRRFVFQFLQKLQKQPWNVITSTLGPEHVNWVNYNN